MAGIDDHFIAFVIAYKISSITEVDSDNVSDATINAIFSRHKDMFEAWMKCPDWLKKKYHNKIPEQILAQAASNVNFTEQDAQIADAELCNHKEPYSYMPDEIYDSTLYNQLKEHHIMLSAIHVAKMKLLAEILKKNAYSVEAANEISALYGSRIALLDYLLNIQNNSLLSENEKQQTKDWIKKIRTETFKKELHIKESDLIQHQPERAVIRLLFQSQKTKQQDTKVLPQLRHLVDQILGSQRLELLANQMNNVKYRKVMTGDTKALLMSVLVNHGVDLMHIQNLRQQLLDQESPQQFISNNNRRF